MAPAPQFVILSYDDSVTVNPNSDFAIQVTVKNVGDAYGEAEVRLKDHNGNIVSSESIAADAGVQLTFWIHGTAPASEGTYSWTLEVYNKTTSTVDDSKPLTVNVTSGGEPHFVIVDYPIKVQVNADEEFQVKVTIKNDGQQAFTCYVAMYDHKGNRQDYAQPSIDVNAEYTLYLTGKAPSYAGTYTWKISVQNSYTGNIDDEKTFTVEVSGPPPPSPWQDLINMLINSMQYIVWVSVIALILVIIISMLKRT